MEIIFLNAIPQLRRNKGNRQNHKYIGVSCSRERIIHSEDNIHRDCTVECLFLLPFTTTTVSSDSTAQHQSTSRTSWKQDRRQSQETWDKGSKKIAFIFLHFFSAKRERERQDSKAINTTALPTNLDVLKKTQSVMTLVDFVCMRA